MATKIVKLYKGRLMVLEENLSVLPQPPYLYSKLFSYNLTLAVI